jgi:hypothetical protein
MMTQSLTQFKLALRDMPARELDAKIQLYRDLKSLNTRDQVLLSCYEAEMERRFLAWEACQA